MSYYQTCKYCGANLDPDETCDCLNETINLSNHTMEDLTHGNNNQNSRAGRSRKCTE